MHTIGYPIDTGRTCGCCGEQSTYTRKRIAKG
jgi:hypothetical protein